MPPASTSPAVRAFGPLRLVVGPDEAELRRRRERNVLATLLAARRRPVSADRLVLEVWGDEAPPQALASLQVAVSRLRSLLEPDRSPRSPARVLVSSAAGYALDLPADAVDLWTFEGLVERAVAASAARDRQDLSDAALRLWHDHPFADCDTDAARREADRLADLRLVAEEVRAQALLDLGEPERAVAALVPLLPENPYRERLWALLAVAQYRCARQTEALETLRTLRSRLADELGIDPSPEVARLEHAVLNQEASLLGEVPPAPRAGAAAPGAPPGTVGRADALETVRTLVERVATTDGGGLLLVSGEPGIGKSRLVQDLAGPASSYAAQVVVGRCHADFAPALWPWIPVLRRLQEQTGDADPDPALLPILSDSVEDTGADAGAVLRLFDAATRLLTRSAARQPLVVVLEDLHWADVTSLRLLAHVAGSGPARGLLLVGTRRTTDAPTSDALVATMAAFARAGATRIHLDGLRAGEVAVLLTGVLGEHEAALDAVVAEATGGNPFFALEYARLVQGLPDRAQVDPTLLPVPEGVRDVLRQRLARLPEAARRLLTTAAVAGRTIDPDLLADLTDTSVDDVLDLVDLSLASGLLTTQAGGYAFAHSLTQEALADELSPVRQVRLHDRISRALEDRPADAVDVARVAHHARLAAPLGPDAAARAASTLARAARNAQARLAYDDALTLWQQAAEAADGLADADLRIEALCGAAHCLLRLARMPDARAAVVEAVGLARASRRWDRVADAAAILNRAGVWAWREHGLKDESLIATLEAALDHVDHARRARILALLQVELYFAWESEQADLLGERSLEQARRTGDSALLIEVLLVNIVASFGPGKAERRLARVEELRTHRLTGELAVFAEFLHARALYDCARVPESDAAAARCADAVAELRHTGVEIPLAYWLLARARGTDDPDATERAAETLRQYRRGGLTGGAGLEVFYELRVGREDDEPVDPALVAAVRSAPAGMRALVAYDVLTTGDLTTALDVLGDPAPPGASDYSVLAGDCLRVAILAAAGPSPALRDALARIEPYRGDVVTYGAVEHLGAVDYFVAAGLDALGERERAATSCAAALDLLERLDNRRWLRRAQQLAARLAGAGTEGAGRVRGR